MRIAVPQAVSVHSECSVASDHLQAIYGPDGCENKILRIEAQELTVRKIVFEDMAKNELESTACEARHALWELQRQARAAVCRALRDSSENHELMMVQELHGFQERHGGQLHENERRIAQMIAFENQKVVRLQRFFLLRKKMFSFSKVKARETSSGAGYAQSCRLKTRS